MFEALLEQRTSVIRTIPMITRRPLAGSEYGPGLCPNAEQLMQEIVATGINQSIPKTISVIWRPRFGRSPPPHRKDKDS